ncbi:hypothetical protein ACAW49_12355 [Pseudomonas sp. Env-44]|jgi:hypothetical protein|uniref:hypothetical protein n=1 Tax=unclassified Pseudomonas TaxID=196821 RepID=UPI000CD40F4B|nr:hypothetical protein [Pseudomonas fluorescens]NKI54325.1 hypothetical protein [Pseudomonas fluorescens]NKI64793.1 hypothetical protein [Pseudomonas fluorescens]POH42606.1 hypothetical protein C2U56_05390 [Pseudomonas fluorescens]
MLTNNQTDLLPIVIEGQTFVANTNGMWNLNETHRELRLPDTKAPSQWRNAVADELRASANLQIIDKVGTLATEAGTIAYAMWVSTDFYLMVVHAFVAMRNSAIRDAKTKDALLAANMPKASTLDMKARGTGLTWTEACRVAGVQQPRLALAELVKMKWFVYPVDSFGSPEGSPRPKKQGFAVGAFVKVSTDFGNKEGWRVKPRGLDWLNKHAEEVNLRVVATKALKAKAKRPKEVTQ